MSNNNFFKSGSGSNFGAWSPMYKKDVPTTENGVNPEIIEGIEDQLTTQGNALETKVDKVPNKALSENDYTNADKTKLTDLPSSSQLVTDLNKKVDKVLGKTLSENNFTHALKSKLENLDVDKLLAGSEETGITIVDGDIFAIHESGFYYANARAINTPREEAGYFILEVLSPRDKQITFVNHNDMTTYMTQEVDGQRAEWFEDTFFTPFLKEKLEGLPNGANLQLDLGGKVDKILGKQLSKNDFTDAHKTKLDEVNLDHIVSGTTHNAINVFNGDIQTITKSGFYYANSPALNKPVSTNGYLLVEATNNTNCNLTYVVYNSGDVYRTQKVSGVLQAWVKDEIFQVADKAKLDGIETGANNYSHPNTHTITEVSGLNIALDGKVDKVTGKHLSENDFTDALKSKLETKALTTDNAQTITGVKTIVGTGELIKLGSSALDGQDGWMTLGNESSYNWKIKYIGSTSGVDGNEFRIESGASGKYYQMDHNGNMEYFDGSQTHKIWNGSNGGAGSGLDADTVDGLEARDLIANIGLSLKNTDGRLAQGDLNSRNITSISNSSGSVNYPTPYGQTWTFQGDTEHRSFSIHRAANGRNLFIKYWNADSTTSDWIKLLHPEDMEIALANKVDKVLGKGLSTNDFTNANKTKLEGVEEAANNYIHPNTHAIAEVSGLNTALDAKVDKVAGKGLSENDLTDALKLHLEYGVTSSHGVTMLEPVDAKMSLTGSQHGAIKITLPQSFTATMMKLEVDIYDYTTNESIKLFISGYNYSTNQVWKNTSVQILATKDHLNYPVRFGHDGSKCCIYIGSLSSAWAYPKVVVSKGIFSHANYESSRWLTGWRVGIEDSAFQSVSMTHTDNLMQNITDGERTKLAGIETGANKYIHPSTHAINDVSGLSTALGNKVDKVSGKGLSTNDFTNSNKTKLDGIATGANNYVHPSTHAINDVSGLSTALGNKVDKVSGKGLSTNDYTNANKTKLDGVATGANNYVHPSTHAINDVSGLSTALGNKVDKVSGKGLSTNDYTNANKTKLDGIATGANNYVHPSTHAINDVSGLSTALDGKADKPDQIRVRLRKGFTGWYTIAVCSGGRAIGRIGLRDTTSSRHQTCVFYASAIYASGNTLNIISNAQRTNMPFERIRIKDGGTYDGAVVQVYVNLHDFDSDIGIYLLDDDFQNEHWVLINPTPDVELPLGLTPQKWDTYQVASEVNLLKGNGSLHTTSDIYSRDKKVVTEVELDSKVDKVSGKALSSNDFTSANKTKLDGIATGANKYVHPSTHSLSEVSGLTTALSGKEASFSKNTAFNKNFGSTSGTVMQGNDSRVGNGQTAYTWGNHASANYIQTDASGNLGLGTSSPQKKLHVKGGFARVQTAYGYADFGADNTSYYHFRTDRPQFYMNRPTQIDGDIKVYGKNTYMRRSDGAIYENGQRISTQSYVNQKEQSLNNSIGNIEQGLERDRILRMVVDRDRDELQLISNAGAVIVGMPLEELRREILR